MNARYTLKPHEAWLRHELERVRRRLVAADRNDSPERGYLLGVRDGLVLAMGALGMDTAPRPGPRGGRERRGGGQ